MKLTFPNMGNLYISVKVLLDELGLQYVLPQFANSKTIGEGVINAPESICLPFKTMLGEFLVAMEEGADCIIFGGGCGQCRLGYYGEFFREVMNNSDRKVNFVFLNTSDMSVGDLWRKFKPYIKGNKLIKLSKALIFTVIIVFYSDKLLRVSNMTRVKEINKGDTDNIMQIFHKNIKQSKGFFHVRNQIHDSIKKMKKVEKSYETESIKILFCGEIYMSLESNVNMNIIKKLGNMGAEVYTNLSVGYWVKNHFLSKLNPIKRADKEHILAKEYFGTDDIGGHGTLTVGSIINAAKKGYQGVVHVYPLGCMPEIAASSAFPHITEKYGIPILSLVLDEMTGEAGLETRLEAFMDMIEAKQYLGKLSTGYN